MAQDRPNILLLHTDQQRFDTLAVSGGKHVHTPNMDRLASRGIAFTSAYSSSPVCMAARHDLMTGATARYHGYWGNKGAPIADYGLPTLPRMLTAAGYQTMAAGKMHFYPAREHHGFEHMALMEELPSCRPNDAYLQFLQRKGYGHVRCQHGVRPMFYHVPQVSLVPEDAHGSAWLAHLACELLRVERDRPFFLYASWVGPHPPYYAPQGYLDLYDGAKLPPARLAEDDDPNRHVSTERDINHRWVRRFKEGYFAAVSLIDAQLGRIIDTLERTGQWDNTLIIFTSDHGEMMGDRRWFAKDVPFEGSAHIPLILAGAGLPENETAFTAVNTLDVSATILGAAGVTPPEGHPNLGENLLELDRADRDRVVISHHWEDDRRWVAAINSRYKYFHRYLTDHDEFYDLEADPWEAHNLAASHEHADILEPLKRACIAFEEEQGQAQRVEDGAFRPPAKEHPGGTEWVNRPNPTRAPWPFCWMQFPRWMNGHTDDDRKAILDQMRKIIEDEGHVFLPADPDWRELVYGNWAGLGGNRAELKAIFDEADATMG